METLQKARVTFGVTPANALWDQLVEQFGEFLAQIIIGWLMSKQHEAAPAGLLDAATLRKWAVALIRQHRQEILDLVGQALDAGLEALGA